MEVDGRVLSNISGDSVFAYISGGSLSADISGSTVYVATSGTILDAIVSGTVVAETSGQAIFVLTSGTVLDTDVSGAVVYIDTSGVILEAQVSGTVTAKISGETVYAIVSGVEVTTDISGELVYVLTSGTFLSTDVSGSTVLAQLTSTAILPTSLSLSGDFKVSVSDLYRKLHASSQTPILSGATYQSDAEDAMIFSKFHGTLWSDVSGGTLYVEQSPDNTNWDAQNSIKILGSVGHRFNTDIDGRYVRVRYVNGPADQGQSGFRIFAWLRVV